MILGCRVSFLQRNKELNFTSSQKDSEILTHHILFGFPSSHKLCHFSLLTVNLPLLKKAVS